MNELLPHAVDGLAAGAACALVAAGVALSLVVRRPVNLSMLALPGAAMLFGGWINGIAEAPLSPVALIVTAGLIVLACCAIWLIIDQFIERPVRAARRPIPLLTAGGVLLLGLVVIERAVTLWPMQPASLPPAKADAGFSSIADPLDWATWIIAAAALAVVLLAMTRTKAGLAMRAVGYRPQTAGLLGINTERLIATAVVMAGALAALGGLLYGARHEQVDAMVMVRPGLVAAIALIAAGPRRPMAVIAVAMGLGSVESFVAATWTDGPALRDGLLVMIGLTAVLARPADRREHAVAAT